MTMLIQLLIAACLWLTSINLQAAARIAVLDFEMKNKTLAPAVPAEVIRTAAIRPLLEQELFGAGYQIIAISTAAQLAAQSGVGYLYDHAEAAAQLGKRYGADYVLVGRLHKPSFLFAYLLGNLVDTGSGTVIGRFTIETKGAELQLTRKAVETMTVKIDQVLDRRYSPPPPATRKHSQP